MKTATLRGMELAYHDEGAGQALLLIHAFPLNSAMWRRQIAELSANCRVIAPDLRGSREPARRRRCQLGPESPTIWSLCSIRLV